MNLKLIKKMFSYNIDEDLKLRLLFLKDTEEVHNLTIDEKEHLRKWMGWVDNNVNDINNTKDFIKNSLNNFINSDGYPEAIGIIYKNKIIGVIGFNNVDKRNKYAIIGYWLSEKYQGKGIMTKATKTLINIAFNELKLNRIEIRVASENIKSRKIPERLGFQKEGEIREAECLYGRYVNSIIYGILSKDWKN